MNSASSDRELLKALLAALEDPASEGFVKDMRALYKRRRDQFVDAMTKAGWVMPKPAATFWGGIVSATGSVVP